MSQNDPLDPLDPALLSLLDAERSRPEEAGPRVDRILARLTTTLGPAGPDGGGGSHGGGAAGAGAAAAGAVKSLAAGKVAALVLGAFAAGIGVGAIGHATLATRETHEAPKAAASTAVAVAPTASASPSASVGSVEPREPASSAATPPASVSVRRPAAHANDDRDPALARERALIEQARMAIARGSAADALAALDSHAREFPSGRMTEEREALAVHALAAAGRTDEARTRAQSFRRRWPSSVFMRLVDRASAPPNGERE
jgi:hypothetical protein